MTDPDPPDRTGEPLGSDLDPDLTTERVQADLTLLSVRSGASQVTAQVVKIALFAFAGMTLARLLTPYDFGVYAMAMSLVALIRSVQDFGFPLAAVQSGALEVDQLEGLFHLNLRLSGLAALLTVVAAPGLARLYDEPAVTGTTAAMAVGLLAMALGWQHRSILMRELRFDTIALIDVAAVAASVVTAVAAALVGAGYWALVLQFVILGVVSSAGYWWRVGWRPSLAGAARRGSAGLEPYIRYGWQYSAARLVSHVGHNLDRVLVAYVHGSRPVGLYDNAYRWAHYPVVHVFPPLVNVAVASLSRARDSDRRYASGVHLGLLPVLSLVLPALAFMAREPTRTILTLLGEQWLDTVPLFRWLSVAAFAKALAMGTRWIYLSEGRTGDYLRWMAVESVVFVFAVSIGVRWGAFGVAVAFAGAACALAGPAIIWCLRGSSLPPGRYLGALWRPCVAAILAMAALVFLGDRLPVNGGLIADLLVRLAVFGIAYVTVWVGLPGGAGEAKRLARLASGVVRR